MPTPDFFIVGAPRCGTTAMYEYLRQHPDVFMPYRKEPVYFGSDLKKRPPYLDEHGYRELFAGARDESRIGEATVWYLYSESAPAEIRSFAPDARIIIMLRNPIDMIHSLHAHFLFTANEDIADFEAALEAEADRRAGRRVPSDAQRPEGLQYRWCGRYAPHVRRYLETFGPDRVLVLIYDDLRADPATVYRRTLEFLDVRADFQPDFDVINESKGVRSAWLQRLTHSPLLVRTTARLSPRVFHGVRRVLKRANMRSEVRNPIDPTLRRRLAREFAPDVADLSDLLGRDLTHWTREASSP